MLLHCQEVKISKVLQIIEISMSQSKIKILKIIPVSDAWLFYDDSSLTDEPDVHRSVSLFLFTSL